MTIHLITVWNYLGSNFLGSHPDLFGEIAFSPSLHSAFFVLFKIKVQNILTSESFFRLTFVVDKWKHHSKVAWKCAAEEKTLLAGRLIWACLPLTSV